MIKNLLLLIAVLSFTGTHAFAQPGSFSPRGAGGGGALYFPRINPGNANEFYVACDMSELFHSTDFGDNYSQVPFTSLQCLSVSTYEYTNNPMIAYCNFNDGNMGYPVKTIDGGATWNSLPGLNTSLEGGNFAIYAMKANYNNPNQLLMNYYGYIVFSNNGGTTFSTVATA